MRTYGTLYPDVPVPPPGAPLIGGGSWTVPSGTWADVSYTVTQAPDGSFVSGQACNCRGCRYEARADGLCKHVDRVRWWLENDPLAAQAAAVLC